MNARTFKEIVSGRKRGIMAGAARAALSCCEVPYRVAIAFRNRQFDMRTDRVHRVSVPVISVGNITAGGTGKTPMVAWIARYLRDRRVVLISRGYGAKSNGLNDEALELELRLANVPHLQNSDRVAAAGKAIEEFEAELIILDDAFQHRRIHRDLDIVLIDALEPFGYERLLPRGLLREPIDSLRRADIIVLSRADLISAEKRGEIAQITRSINPRATWAEVAHRPRELVTLAAANGGSSASESAETLNGRRVAAFCGIGNPAAFRLTLENCGAIVTSFREFEDHHSYSEQDIASLAKWISSQNVDMALCTMKDLVKLRVSTFASCPVRALSIDVEFLCGASQVESRLNALVMPRG